MIERRNGTYCACGYNDDTKAAVKEWMSKVGIEKPINIETLHSTIIYSRVKLEIEDHVNYGSTTLKDLGWKFKIKRFDRFPTKPGSDVFALVGVLDAVVLEDLHQSLLEKGATHDFDEYHPHVTFTYDLPESFDISSLAIPDIVFIPEEVYCEPLDLNWMGT